MAQPGQAQPSFWVQLFPFALMLVIFYLLVLLPMRRRQKKIQEFQSSLKVGDKVITTGGIYGQVTEDREEDARAAPDCRQGPDRCRARPPSAGYRARSRSCSRRAAPSSS